MHRSAAIALAGLAAQAAAHGYINTFEVDGTDYPGYNKANPGERNLIGWSFTTSDEGPVTDPTSEDMICRHGGANAPLSAEASPGSQLDFFWTSNDKERNPDGWAESHHGPIITYIAPCNGDCATVDKTSLKFVKISQSDIVSGPETDKGTWATDEMRAKNGWTSATLPENIAPGNYVVRNEIIALHKAHEGIPEFYMICANLEVGGSGTDKMEGGVVGTALYSKSDQIFGWSVYDEYQKPAWVMPGPDLYEGAATSNSSSPATPSTPTQEETPESEDNGTESESGNGRGNDIEQGVGNGDKDGEVAVPGSGNSEPEGPGGPRKPKNHPCKVGENNEHGHGYSSGRRHPRDLS